MRLLAAVLVTLAVIAVPSAQSPADLLSDTRLSVHTLVREDIFAAWRNDDVPRLERAERHLETLLAARPAERPNLLAWKGGIAVYRAVVAHEAGRSNEFSKAYASALSGFAEAASATSGNGGVAAITGGTFAVFADRLPEPQRAAAWSQAYDNYLRLWNEQGAEIEKLPVHHKGEVLAGLTQSAQRTGRTEEAARHLDRMLVVLAGTPYESLAKQWKENPALAATTNLTCRNCHAPGRLENRVTALKTQAPGE